MKMGNLDFPYVFSIHIYSATQIQYARTAAAGTSLRQRSAFRIYFSIATGKLCTRAARLRVHGNAVGCIFCTNDVNGSSGILQHPASRTALRNPFLSFPPPSYTIRVYTEYILLYPVSTYSSYYSYSSGALNWLLARLAGANVNCILFLHYAMNTSLASCE